MIEQSLLNVTYMVRSLDREDPLEEGLATPLQYSCLENPREQKSLAGHSPRVSRELVGLFLGILFFWLQR